jgi:class I lanthipeptide synthase
VSWAPLVTDPERAREIACAIAATLVANESAWTDRANTWLEIALLLEHLRRGGLEPPADPGYYFERGVLRLQAEETLLYLFGGVCGLGCMVIDLADEATAELVCEPIDRGLLAVLGVARWEHEFELIRGLAGIATYALQRPARPSSRRIAERVLHHLEATIQERDAGVVWWTPAAHLPEHLASQHPEGWLNLGVSHGIPGVIGVLARYLHAGVEPVRARRLLERAVTGLLSLAPASPGPRFPAYLDRGETRTAPTRLAWCYGDLGIAVMLLAAARAASEPDWEREAIDLATAAARRSYETSGVVDAGLCHGAAGNAHLFARLHAATGDATFAAAARGWYERVFAFRKPGKGIGGYVVHRQDEELVNASFLEGAIGIALALLSATQDVDPVWDRRLLADVGAFSDSARP